MNEVVIIGGGVIGLATAIELKLRGVGITLLTKNRLQAASRAAAGMLAPHAERLKSPSLFSLCKRSLYLYQEWIDKLEDITGSKTGYHPCGIIAPVYEVPSKTPYGGIWLEKEQLKEEQPGLSEKVVGAWWYPDDGQVDNRLLMQTLQEAAQIIGVDILEGVSVSALQQREGRVERLITSAGQMQARIYILATGAYTSQLLPLPVRPVKGQMLALKMPKVVNYPLPLQRVIFGPDIYLVPRQDGRLIIGATVEEVGWTHYNTPKGLQSLLDRAISLYPALEDYPIQEMWWGFRPGTPDESPIIGNSHAENLLLAVGHYRNGILLAPITAKLITDLLVSEKRDPLLEEFSAHRFTSKPPLLSSASPMTSLSLQLPKTELNNDHLVIAGRVFNSRLMTGTGKYPDITTMQQCISSSGCDIVTVAVRRVQTNAPGHEGLAQAIDWGRIWMLPNTAGCKTADEAIRVARLGREMAKLLGQEDNNFVKLEVIPDLKYLLPDPIGTLEAAEQLVKEGFAVLPYINADPLLAKRLEEVGCVTVMPLGSPIGSGQGIKNAANIAIIIEESKIPVVVDAGIGSPSEAAYAMEMGASALLVNSAIALAKDPVRMAKAMRLATEAGRDAYLAGRIPVKSYALASSPLTGLVS